MRGRSKALFNLSTVAMSVALITVCAWIYVPLPIGFTLQTFAIFLVSGCFPLGISLCSVLLYLCLGIIGIPVFSGFGGGFSAIVGPSGGFLIAFPVACLIIALFQKRYSQGIIYYIAAMTFAQTVCYVFGCIWYILVFSYPSGIGIGAALTVTVLPFIVTDALKILLTSLVYKRLHSYLKRLPI